MIELHQLNKSFGQHVALRDVNLFIQEGEIFAIIGKSGAGKSTLLRCLNALEKPDQGEVLIDQEIINTLSRKKLRQVQQKIGMIFQHFNLLSCKTVYENIALPMRIQNFDEVTIKTKLAELLALVELEDKVDTFPGQLSGGQKQRVAIARALSCSPKILLCDEATSALDPETTQSILELLQKINRLYGITIVLITHEMDVVKRLCHRVAVMESGKIIETATLASLFENKKSILRQLLYSQLSPSLPACLSHSLSPFVSNKPLLRLFFQADNATVPFISRTSQALNIDINILLANIDRFDTVTYGVLVVELNVNAQLLNEFIACCEKYNITVEILGYVVGNGF